MANRKQSPAYTIFPTFATLLFAGNAWAMSEEWWVTNNGADSPSCGSKTKPCRSISQAIENASADDVIEVGAGRYGNVTGGGTFSGPGDEHSQLIAAAPSSEEFGQQMGCIVCITKPLQIYSLHGAAVTIVEGTPSSMYPATVLIASPKVVFGAPGAGFTVTGGNAIGVDVDQNFLVNRLGQNITIEGDVDLGDHTGFSFTGQEFTDRPCPVPQCQPTAQVLLANNEPDDNLGTGFAVAVRAFFGPGGVALRDNVARGAGTGFSVATGFQSEDGSARSAGNVSLVGNVAAHNGLGFSTNLSGLMQANTAVGNLQAGILVVPSGRATFRGNSSIGNGGPGVIVNFSADRFDNEVDDQSHAFQVFNQNNLYGNDRHRPPLLIALPNDSSGLGLDPGPSAHCGVLNVGAVAALMGPGAFGPIPTEKIPATGNYWGSLSGPSSTSVGDAAGGVCDQNGGVTVAKPFATVAFGITNGE